MVEKEKDLKVKSIRSDRGGEFLSENFARWCKSEGIRCQLTTPYTPSQNGVVERKNRTIMEMARAMLAHASLPRSYWAEACNTAVYIQNRSPTHALQYMTPFQAYYGRKPTVSHFRVFGCSAFVHIPKEKRQKLDFKSRKLLFLGYSAESDAYRLYDPDTRTTTVSRDVVFDESFITSAEGAAAQPIPILPTPSLPDPPASPVITPSTSHPVPPIQPPDVSPDHALSDSDSDLDVADATPEVDSAPPCGEKRIPGWLYSTVASSGVTELPMPPPAGLPRRCDRKVDCVYLTHMTDLLSAFHLQFGFQTFAAQPYSKKWFMWMMWPIELALALLICLFAKPFIGASHYFGNTLELQTWVIPRFSFQYSWSSEAARINGWIQESILQAQRAGAKVFALGLLNKDFQMDLDEVFLCKTGGSIAIVTGETLAAAIVVKKVEANHQKELDIFITSAQSRVGRAISVYLCEHGFRVLVLLPSSKEHASLRSSVSSKFKDNLVYATNYDAGASCKVWLVGDRIGRGIQNLAPRGAYFYPFDVFPIREWRKDCTYGIIPSLKLPKDAQNINSCEDILPRNVVRAGYAAAMVYAREDLRCHDCGGHISLRLMDEAWELAMKHGFTVVNELKASC
ncbi:hypothetical protein L7F22_017197 [Adiantum nelumboides]|nr:hypothetical protein [Adiantum nelumboides]